VSSDSERRAAFVVVYLLRGFGPDACRYLLASPAVFALITLLSRMGTPESARWPVWA
jgi:putative MFS transporter